MLLPSGEGEKDPQECLPGVTSSAPVTEYACPFTSFWNVMASESAALVICKRGRISPASASRLLPPSLPRSGPTAGRGAWVVGERAAPLPPRALPPSRRYLQPEERLQAALGGRRTCTRVCAPRSHKFPQEKGTPCRGGSGHTPGRPKCAESLETARIALPRPVAGFTRGQSSVSA